MITIYDWLTTNWVLMNIDIDYHCYDCYYAYCCCWLLTNADDYYIWLIDGLLIMDDYWYRLSLSCLLLCLLSLLLITDDWRASLYMTDWCIADYWWLLTLASFGFLLCLLLLLITDYCRRVLYVTDWWRADYWWLLIFTITVMIVITLVLVVGYWRLPMIAIWDWLMTCWLLMTIDIDYQCYGYVCAYYCRWLLAIADEYYIVIIGSRQ